MFSSSSAALTSSILTLILNPIPALAFPLLLSPSSTSSSSPLDISGLLSSLGPASPNDPRFTTWKAAGANDVRSPCPGLNALANHNFIHHDGKNLTIPHLLQGLSSGLNMGADFTVLIGGAGLLASPNPLGGSFDLDDLDQHNFPIEHDASLSRKDAYFGNDYSFNQDIWNQVLAYWPSGRTDIVSSATAIANRTVDSQRTNPTFTYGLREFVFRYGEMAIALQAMGGDDITGVTRVDWLKSLFEQERLPVALGWKPRSEPVTLPSLGAMVLELFVQSPSSFKEGFDIGKDSYKDVFELLVGGSEVLGNLTGGISQVVGL